jgi:hypothetical protein
MRARPLALVLAAAALLIATAMAATRDASAAHEDCGAFAEGVFLYHTTVIPVTRIECATVKKRIRISAVLSRDGVDVRSSRRDCRNRSVCYLSVDVSVEDVPGDQRWCVRVWGSIDNNHALPAASVCESESF